MSTRTSFTCPKGYKLHVEFGACDINIALNPHAEETTVLIETADDSGSSARAVSESADELAGSLYTVRVGQPDPVVMRSGNSTMVFNGNASSVIQAGTISGNIVMTGGSVFINGREVRSDHTLGPRPEPVKVFVILAAKNDGISVSGDAGTVNTTGALPSLEARTVSGDIYLDHVGNAHLTSVSGDVMAHGITGTATIANTSGGVQIDRYTGSGLSVNNVSGGVVVRAKDGSSGSVSVNSVSGSIRVTGAGHLAVAANTVSGRKTIA